MSKHVILAVTYGSLEGKECVFEDHARVMVGRAPDCDLQLPMTMENADVSRHHCVFEIDPPDIRVRDAGSRNGTYINGQKIGPIQRSEQPDADTEVATAIAPALHDGDEGRIGHNLIRVEIREDQLPASAFLPHFV